MPNNLLGYFTSNIPDPPIMVNIGGCIPFQGFGTSEQKRTIQDIEFICSTFTTLNHPLRNIYLCNKEMNIPEFGCMRNRILADIDYIRILKDFFKGLAINFDHIPYLFITRNHVKYFPFIIVMRVAN